MSKYFKILNEIGLNEDYNNPMNRQGDPNKADAVRGFFRDARNKIDQNRQRTQPGQPPRQVNIRNTSARPQMPNRGQAAPKTPPMPRQQVPQYPGYGAPAEDNSFEGMDTNKQLSTTQDRMGGQVNNQPATPQQNVAPQPQPTQNNTQSSGEGWGGVKGWLGNAWDTVKKYAGYLWNGNKQPEQQNQGQQQPVQQANMQNQQTIKPESRTTQIPGGNGPDLGGPQTSKAPQQTTNQQTSPPNMTMEQRRALVNQQSITKPNTTEVDNQQLDKQENSNFNLPTNIQKIGNSFVDNETGQIVQPEEIGVQFSQTNEKPLGGKPTERTDVVSAANAAAGSIGLKPPTDVQQAATQTTALQNAVTKAVGTQTPAPTQQPAPPVAPSTGNTSRENFETKKAQILAQQAAQQPSGDRMDQVRVARNMAAKNALPAGQTSGVVKPDAKTLAADNKAFEDKWAEADRREAAKAKYGVDADGNPKNAVVKPDQSTEKPLGGQLQTKPLYDPDTGEDLNAPDNIGPNDVTVNDGTSTRTVNPQTGTIISSKENN